MRRRSYLRALGGLPLVAAGASGCLSDGTNGPTERALTAQQIGEAWAYTEGGSPTVTDSGTIVANYRTSEPYPQTVRLRLWPCEGETLEALGGTCSLGNLQNECGPTRVSRRRTARLVRQPSCGGPTLLPISRSLPRTTCSVSRTRRPARQTPIPAKRYRLATPGLKT
jgi:hypothetical protein